MRIKKMVVSVILCSLILCFAESSYADCSVRVDMRNENSTGRQPYYVTVYSKVKGGWYKEQEIEEIYPETAEEIIFKTDYSCDKKHRYKFEIEEALGTSYDVKESTTYYYPSSSGWTTDIDFDIGDISRFF